MASGRRCGGHQQEAQGTHTDAACLGMGTQGSWKRNGTEAPWRKKRPSRQAGAEGVHEPPRTLPSSQCHPQCRRKGERPRERSMVWERHLAALPSWSWGCPQGRAGGWHEGGRICGESCGLELGPAHGPRGAVSCNPVSLPGNWLRRPYCPWEMGLGGGPCL